MKLTTDTELQTVKSILNRLFAHSTDGFFLMTLKQSMQWDANLPKAEKEKQLKEIFKNFSFQSFNKALLTQFNLPLTGANNDKILSDFQSRLFDSSFEKVKRFWMELFDEGRKNSTLFMKTVTGNPLIVEGEYTVLYDKQGKLISVFGLQKNITDEVTKEKNISDRELYLKSVWDKANIGVLIMQDEKIVYYNSYIADYYIPRKLKPNGDYELEDLLFPEDLLKVSSLIKKRKDGDNTVFSYDVKVIKSKDETEGVLSVYSSLFSWKGKSATLIFASDVTEQRRIEKELAENEQRYRLLAENSIDGIALYDNGKLQYASPSYFEMFPKMKQNDDYEKYTKTYVYKEDVKNVKFLLNDMLAKKMHEGNMRYRVLDKKKNIHWIEDRLKIVFSDDGKWKLQVLAIDVTERVENVFSLKESENKLKFLMNTINDIIFHTDEDGIILYVSDRIESLGYKASEIMSKNIIEFVDYDGVSTFLDFFAMNDIESIQNTFFTVQFQTKDNRVAWLEISANRSSESDKTIVLVARNVTERRLTEWKLEQYQDEMEQMLAIKDKSFSVIAHDLRMPFNQILGFSELLKRNLYSYDKGKIEHFVNIIYKASMQSYNLLENLLQWSLWQQNQLIFTPEKLNVKNMVEAELERMEMEIKVKSLVLETELQDIEGLYDANMLRSIVRNILNNAVHFTPNRGRVTISLKQQKKSVILEIKDTGIGMESEKVKELLSDNTDFNKQKGFGILLVKTFLKYHNGALYIDSVRGKGTRVQAVFKS